MFTGRPELNVALQSTNLAPGQEVRGVVRITSEAERQVDRGFVALRCEERYEYRERRRSSGSRSGSHITSVTDTNLLLDQEQEFIGATLVLPGESAEYPFSLAIPQNAPPTYQGEILKLRWFIHARLDLDRAFDSKAEVDLVVYHPPEGPYPQPRFPLDQESHSECNVAVQLESEVVGAGGIVRGVLRIEPREEFEAQEVRAQLRRVEHVPQREGNTSTEEVAVAVLTGESSFMPGVPMDLPFELAVPATPHPSTYTAHAAVYWEVDLTLARRLRGDLHLIRSLHVYSMPAGE